MKIKLSRKDAGRVNSVVEKSDLDNEQRYRIMDAINEGFVQSNKKRVSIAAGNRPKDASGVSDKANRKALWNLACDHVVNDALRTDGFSIPFPTPIGHRLREAAHAFMHTLTALKQETNDDELKSMFASLFATMAHSDAVITKHIVTKVMKGGRGAHTTTANDPITHAQKIDHERAQFIIRMLRKHSVRSADRNIYLTPSEAMTLVSYIDVLEKHMVQS